LPPEPIIVFRFSGSSTGSFSSRLKIRFRISAAALRFCLWFFVSRDYAFEAGEEHLEVFLAQDHVVDQPVAVDGLVQLGDQSLEDELDVRDGVLVLAAVEQVVEQLEDADPRGVELGVVVGLGLLAGDLVHVVVLVVGVDDEEVLERVHERLGVEVVQEVVGVVLVAVEVRADLFLVLLEERADHLPEVAGEHAVDLVFFGEQAEEVVEVLFVVGVLVDDQQLRALRGGRERGVAAVVLLGVVRVCVRSLYLLSSWRLSAWGRARGRSGR
jgi:hypothetical protein